MEIAFLSGACITYKGKTLLLKQAASSRHANLWGPPGGHRESNETLIETAKREVKEETDLDVEIKGLIQGGVKEHEDGRISIIAIYYATTTNPENIKLDTSENTKYQWVSLEEIKSDKYTLRDPLLKPILIKSLTEKPLPLDSFLIF